MIGSIYDRTRDVEMDFFVQYIAVMRAGVMIVYRVYIQLYSFSVIRSRDHVSCEPSVHWLFRLGEYNIGPDTMNRCGELYSTGPKTTHNRHIKICD